MQTDSAPKTVLEKAREVPVKYDVDVLVVGGGFAGFGAALCAAKNGAKTMVVEQLSALGGLVTMGYVALVFSYLEGYGHDLFARLKAENGVKGRFLDLEKTKRVMEQMLMESGVSILYNSMVVDAIVTGNVLHGAIVHNKSGREAIWAKRVVDASGDGDISAYAGVPFECGCPELENYNQASSLVCRIGNVDYEKYIAGGAGSFSKWEEAIKKAVDNGDFPYLIDKRLNWLVVVPGRDKCHQEVFICYAHSRKCKCIDAQDLTRQIIEQRVQNKLFMDFCNKYIPGFENAWLIDTAPLLGVRDSRRIMCEYKLTVDDIIEGRTFEDGIMRAIHPLDCHHPTEPGHIKHVLRKNSHGEEEKRYVMPGSWREVPYRALVPLKIDNLLVAGRNFSSDFMAQSGNRLVLECFNMGQAAGTAAALSLKENVAPRRLDAGKLKQRLIEMNIRLDEKPKYGSHHISTEKKVEKDDVFVSKDKTASEPPGLKKEALHKYRILSLEETDSDDRTPKKNAADGGYTTTGGDVGTNME